MRTFGIPHRSAGLTLVELLVTVSVLAILLGVAAPSFHSFIQNNRATTATNDVVAALHLARSEALKRRQNVTVCAGLGNVCQNVADWTAGWQVVAGGQAIQVWTSQPGVAAISGPGAGITFTATGMTTLVANAVLTVASPHCTGDERRTITVLPTGRMHTERTAC